MKKIDVQVILMDNGYAVSSVVYPGYIETKTIHATLEAALDKAQSLIQGTFRGFKKAEEERLLSADNSDEIPF